MKIFLTAGEPSGDTLGAALIDGLRSEVPDVELRGVAGPRMQAAGMESLFPMRELSVMGIAEVLPKYFHLKRRIRETAQAALDWGADIVVTIDSPDFSLRVQRLIREACPDQHTVHYVAPTVWAWRPERAGKMAKTINHVLALFPFEPPYMQAAGMACDFVGHPIATWDPVTATEISDLRAEAGLGDGPLAAVLAGSRGSEVKRLLPIFAGALGHKPLPEGTRLIFPTLPHLAPAIAQATQALPYPVTILDGAGQDADQAARARHVAMAASNLALAASGTISLELAHAGTPMVIAYDMAPLTKWVVKRKLITDTVTLVNLVSETRAVPEFIFEDCTPDKIAAALAQLHGARAAQEAAMAVTMDRLGQGGPPPGLRAAQAILAQAQSSGVV